MRRSSGFLALLGIGLYYAWRNRFEIQRFLESNGIDVPLSTRTVGDTIRSGVAKVRGSVEHGMKQTDRDIRRTA
jgi:hypothetical protein